MQGSNGLTKNSTLRRAISMLFVDWRLLVGASLVSLLLAVLWLAPPLLVSLIVDRGISSGDASLASLLSGLLIVSAVLIAGVDAVYQFCVSLLSERFVRRIRTQLFDAVQGQSYTFFVDNSSGKILSRLWNDVSGVQMAVGATVTDSLGAILSIIVSLTVMFIWNWQLALLVLPILPLVFGVSFVAGKLNHSITDRMYMKLEQMMDFTAGVLGINGFIVRRGFGYDLSMDSRRFAGQAADLQRIQVTQALAVRVTTITIVTLPLVASGLLYMLGSSRVISEDVSLGTLLAFIAIALRLASPVSSMASLHVSVFGALAPFARIFEWIDLPNDTKGDSGSQCLSEIRGLLAFRNVSFAYEPNKPVLRGISFSAKPGQTLALVGPTGAGKTTVVNLILRFCEQQNGRITLDEHDIREFRLNSLYQFTAIVPQESIVFSTSVRDNLLIAKSDATDDEIYQACRFARFLEVVESLPDGLDTMLGEFGYRLSGGERQRLSIARAILKRPKILIMDEPTSSLDAITENVIQQFWSANSSDRTTIVIAHRLSTILNSDVIVVLDEGRCVDIGSHEELFDRCALYRHLYQNQFAQQSK